jgi:prepilin-type N-terminal cleavage/methylation domain-containing protein
MKERLDRHKGDSGFTLFELLIVIIILAILAGMVVYSVGTSNTNALTSACQSDAKAFGTALEEYKSAVGTFPGATAVQVTGPTNPSPQPVPNTGATWTYQLSGTYGLLGNMTALNPSGDWTAPNGVTVAPFLRELPSTQNYRIVTDGNGGVFVYPPNATVNRTATGMENQTVAGIGGPDNSSLNFETNPGICSDSYVVT